MIELTLEKLNAIRKEGFRPGVVACILHDGKLLMVYKKEHKIWQLPQGRIDNKETPEDALKRNLLEELGEDFVANLELKKVEIVDEDKMEFKPGRHHVDPIQDDEGTEIDMVGKEYFFCVVRASTSDIDISKTEYDQNFWMSFREAYFLADKMYQRGKRRITIKILNTLNKLGYLE